MKIKYEYSKAEIKKKINTNWAGKSLFFFDSTESTNEVATKLGKSGEVHGTLVVADGQSKGKGRRGRSWSSPFGKDIYMTLLLRPCCKLESVSTLTLVMALSVMEAVSEVVSVQTLIKWPNDIVLNGKKLCGILTEMYLEPDNSFFIVIGAGINCNQTDFIEEISNNATSLFLEEQKYIDRAKLIGSIMSCFERNYEVFEKTQDLSELYQKYNKFLVNAGREVRVLDPAGEYNAVAEGINKSGELIVHRIDNGEAVTVYAGEVSVRGIYGYV